MEDQSVIESEEISDSFVCFVCLDLLYKPIVLSCGHISCFWCAYSSMSGESESHCPICRHPYNHFPTICQLLHFLLMKMYPVTYKRRENQTLEEEKKNDMFSPQLDRHAFASHAVREFHYLDNTTDTAVTSSEFNPCSNPKLNREREPWTNMEQSEFDSHIQNDVTSIPKRTCHGSSDVIRAVSDKIDGHHEQVSVADLLCAACKEMLFNPVVLNCGHVYCQTCIINSTDALARCHVCQSLHPRSFPKVCLELDHFLEENFPQEYALRREAVKLKQIIFKPEITTSSTEAGKQGSPLPSMPTRDHLPWWADLGSKVHRGVGCDSCGIMPIIGDRYKCVDCVEKTGFDLCGDCYNTPSKLPGRFNQQHTPEHKFELVKVRNRTLRLFTLVEDGSTALVISDDTSEQSENDSPSSTSHISTVPATFTDSVENQNDDQSTN